MHEIADRLCVSVGSVYKYIHFYGIPAREPHKGFLGKHHKKDAKEKIGKAHKGKVLSDATRNKISMSNKIHGIGHRKKRCDGYIALYYPEHPKASKSGYVMEHDYLMEQKIGRLLKDNEVVHHINYNRSDNRLENLKLMTMKEHCSFHAKERWKKRKEC